MTLRLFAALVEKASLTHVCHHDLLPDEAKNKAFRLDPEGLDDVSKYLNSL